MTCFVAISAQWGTIHAATPSTKYKVGETVECDPTQIGSYFKTGKIVAIQERPGWPDPFYIVQFADSRDPMRCLPKEMRAASAAGNTATVAAKPAAKPQATMCRPGAKIEVASGISWYAGTVKGPPDATGRCPVHRDGYPELYDVLVTDEMLRPRGSGPIVTPSGQSVIAKAETAPATEKPKASAATGATGAPPDGTYKCHKMSPNAPLMQVGAVDVRGGKPTFRGGLPDGWTLRDIRYQGTNPRGQPLLIVEYRSKAGFNDRLDCVPG